VINRLQQSHALVILIADNLTQYMGRIRGLGEVLAGADPAEFSPDGRYSHTAQVEDTINFLDNFLLYFLDNFLPVFLFRQLSS
jgi:ubiquitin carboxyl-terminal hydrolase 9/24